MGRGRPGEERQWVGIVLLPLPAGQHKLLRSSGYSFWNPQRRSGLSAATSLVF